MATIWKVLTRKKTIDPISAEETRLSRVLNTFDLTALGVGSTLGVGVYVIAGHVAKDTAGPAVILSFLIAAIASVFAGLCYAEFGARAPRAGSAYIYSYVCVGEFIAFVIGWNLILEYVIGSASVAKALSLYLDQLCNSTMQKTFIDIAPLNIPYMATYFDFFSFGISMVLSIALAFGMKESSWTNNIFTVINIGVVLFVIVAGSLKADPANWAIVPDYNTTNSTAVGKGGFFPFGIEGMIKGAATCFYGFVGFDCIATTGEEVKNPKRAIPISIVVSLFIIFFAYFGTSTVVTMMVPYYLQNPEAPIPYAFEHVGWHTAKWIVSIGGIFGLCASLFGAMFPLPRILYAMANDSLVFKFLGKVSVRFQTPVVGTLLAGLLTGLMSAMFELKQLVDMMSIGTLLAYTIVAASILLLRYSREELRQYMPVQTISDSDESETYTDNKFDPKSDEDRMTVDELGVALQEPSGRTVLGQMFNCDRHNAPTKISETIVTVELFIYCIACLLIGLSAMYLKGNIMNGELWAIVLTSVVVFVAVAIIISMVTQPTSKKEVSFKVPLVPLVPALSILMNVYLMLMLDSHTWIRFAVWMAIGLPVYYCSVRPYSEAQNKNVSSKSSIIDRNISVASGGQNGKTNGIANVAFVGDDEAETPRKRRAPTVPVADATEIPTEIVKLDEILEEISNSIDSIRKLSVGTLSNVSAVVSLENVVAVVHRDDLVSPANSFPPSSPLASKHEPENDDAVTDVPLQGRSPERINSIDSLSSSDSAAWESLLSENDNPVNSSTETLTLTATPMMDDTVPIIHEGEPSKEQAPVPPPLPAIWQPETLRRDEIKSVVRPTSKNLNSVTLKPLKQTEKQRETLYEPDDDNLVVGSEKYKSFMASLNGKLQKPVLPVYIPYVKKEQTIIEPTPREPNENVIEESIDQEKAKAKLGVFIRDDVKMRAVLSGSETVAGIEETAANDGGERVRDGAYVEHQNRMQNVFRSINLKKRDSIKDSALEEGRRNVRSLGSSVLSDDNSQHRQAMSEIFKSIKLRRKDSKKQEDK